MGLRTWSCVDASLAEHQLGVEGGQLLLLLGQFAGIAAPLFAAAAAARPTARAAASGVLGRGVALPYGRVQVLLRLGAAKLHQQLVLLDLSP